MARRQATVTITLADALGAMSPPLARTLSWWAKGPKWRIRAVRVIFPDLARALDELRVALEGKIGPL